MIRLTIWGEREESSKIGGRENHIPPPHGGGWCGLEGTIPDRRRRYDTEVEGETKKGPYQAGEER